MRRTSTTIEQLELEVQSNSASAVGGIDALASSLGKLKNATRGGVGLTAVAKQLTTLNSALSGISGANADNLNKLAQGLQTLSSCGNLKLSSSVSTQITNIGSAVQSLGGTDFSALTNLANALTPLSNIGKANLNSFISQLQRLPQAVQALNSVNMGSLASQINQLVSALSPLSQMGRNNLTSFVTQLQRLPQVMTALRSVNMGQLASQIQQLANALSPLATQMQSIANGFSAFPARIQRLIQSNSKLSASNSGLGKSYVNLAAKISMAYVGLRKIAGVIAGWITDSNRYIEHMNLFNVSMGQYADEARQYAEQVGEIMGINPGEWMRNQGVFMTLADGFGVAGDRAYTMSKNLTQLTYDLSSFFNISTADAFQKVESGISGELEPLRRLGYDLSVARLQQEAYNLGIEKSVTKMTQAEKAELRYYAIMTQVTTAQGDMARTLEAPTNQLRILKAQMEQATRALGNLFLPILKAILPYAIALAKAIRMVAEIIAGFFDVSIPEFDMGADAIGGVAGGAGEAADGLGDAFKKAKELKSALLGIDELNVISPPDDSAGGAGAGGLSFDLPTYDFVADAVNEQVDKIMAKIQPFLDWVKEHIDEILAGVLAIGTAFLAWKIAKGVQDFLHWLSTMKGFNIVGSIGFKIAGLGLFLDAWNTMKEAIQDIMANGPNFTNVTKLISGFAEALGAAFLLFGNIKMAGAMLVISGLTGIVSAISDMVNNNDVNWDNALFLVKNLGLFLTGIGLLSDKNFKLAGIGLIITGATLIVDNLKGLITAIRTGDWSGVDAVELAAGALMAVGGFILTLKKLDQLKDSANAGQAAKQAFETVTDTTSKLDNTINTGLSPKLVSLAKNLGLGLAIIAEVSAAALLIVGAIALMGMELEQVGIAWEPVIANGGTVATAIGLGAGILAAVGLATAGLGSVGTTLIVNIGLGTAILAELGVATGLFLVEVWSIGKGLDEIGQAWQPVLDNGKTIATGIGIGTGLLVGIGVVTAALGAATVASAGLLPLAIGLGTALLVELAAALILFIESLVAVADELGNNLAPALDDLNGKLPGLTTNMSDFVDFMTAFAGEVVRYTGASAVSGLSATIDTIIGWFTQDPIEKMSNDVNKIAGQAKGLNGKLNVAIPELRTAVKLLGEYVNFVDELGKVAGSGGTVKLSEGLKVNLKTVGENIVTGFNEGIKNKYSTIQSNITNWGKDVQKWFNNSSFGGVNKETFGKYATDIVNGFKNGIVSLSENARSGMTTWANNTKKYFTNIISSSAFYDIAKDVIRGFNNGINDFYDTSRTYMRRWANDAKEAYKTALDSNSPSKVFMRIGEDTVLGYNLGIMNLGSTTESVVDSWANSFTSVSPVMRFAVDTSALKYYTSDSFSRSVSADVTSSRNFSVTGFKEGMEEFYREHIDPMLSQMAEYMRRQADKNEQTIVQIGNRTVMDAVVTQQKANGYKFTK